MASPLGCACTCACSAVSIDSTPLPIPVNSVRVVLLSRRSGAFLVHISQPLELSGADDVPCIALVAPANVFSADIEHPLLQFPLHSRVFEEQSIPEIPIALVPRGVALDIGSPDPEINRSRPG